MRLDRVTELAPGMRHATDVDEIIFCHGGVVSVIAVSLQISRVAFQQVLGNLGATPWIVMKQHHRLIRRSAALQPQVGFRLRFPARLFQHLHLGLIHLHDVIA